MISHAKERISLEEMKTALKENKELEILSLGTYWDAIGTHVYDRFREDEKYLEKCYKNWNYRIKVIYE